MDLGSKEGTSKTNDPSSSTTTKLKPIIAITQYHADAKLLDEFEQSEKSGKSFDYSKSIKSGVPDTSSNEKMVAYLSKIQSGGLIQSFGCTIAVEIPSFSIIAYSENTFDLLGIIKQNLVIHGFDLNVGSLLGLDARILFTRSAGNALAKVAACSEISLLNPILVNSRSSQRSFYAIVHKIGVGFVIDLEPAKLDDPVFSIAGAVQSQKLAVRAISHLQSLPGGNIGLLCDTVAENVKELTGYDRVMVYKFHEDEHGEVVSEIKRSDLEPYLGLHYPATDIPQAARFLFKQNRVRMICDCHAKPVGIIQSERLKQPLCLVNSTLRAPHDCHNQYMSNMSSFASLVMAVIVNKNESTRVWGLVVCHHSSRRYVPYPLRYACEFLMQAFGLQLNMELKVATQLAEKMILNMQTILCDMLLRNAPDGIVTQSPNIMDLVKCDGAAMYYGGTCWLLGVTPTREQIEDIANWLLTHHADSTGMSTDSLYDAGYPGAALLGDEVCGMASARITSKDFLFWFRSHTAKEVKWAGAKPQPEEKDDDGRMHPRSSFKAFLDGVKRKSFPWEIYEINGIHSLQLIMRRSFQDTEHFGAKAMIYRQLKDSEIQGMDRLSLVSCETVRLIATATSPILGVDSDGLINGWNTKVAELTGLATIDAMGKSLVNDLVYQESRTVVENHISRALQGVEDKNVELKLRTFGVKQHNQPVFILADACSSKDYSNGIVGVCFVGQNVTEEKTIKDKFVRLEADYKDQTDYKDIIQSHNSMIPPIFASDDNACCCEWNAAMEKLTGWAREEVIGKMLIGEIFGRFCQLKSQDVLTKFMILIHRAIVGEETEKLPFDFLNKEGKYIEVLLTTNKRTDMSGKAIGCFCFMEEPVPADRDVALQLQRQGSARLEELTYIGKEMKDSLSGIQFTHKLLATTIVSDEQKRILQTGEACERQLMTIINDMVFGNFEESRLKPNNALFILGDALDAIVSQVMILLKEKGLQLIHDISNHIKSVPLFGDQIRFQQVLSVILQNVVHHASIPGGWVEINVTFNSRLNEDGIQHDHLEIRMAHSGEGVPSEVIQDMFEEGNRWATHEGLRLRMSRTLLKAMNGGHVQYVRESNRCYFLITVRMQAT